MTTIFNLYGQHGLLINCLVLIGLVVLSVGVAKLKAAHPWVISAIKAAIVTAALVLILIMTLSPFKQGVGEGFESLQVSQVVTRLIQPQTADLDWPDWHDPIGNVLMTVPLATALALTWTKRRTMLAIAALSIAIETTQHFYGHGRTPQLSDVVLNTLGGAVGVGLAALSAVIAERIIKRKVPGRESDPSAMKQTATYEPAE